MSDTPVRSLMLQTSDAFERQLLQSARSDVPEPGARDRALLGLGLAPVGLLTTAPPAAAAAAPGTTSVLAVGGKAVPWVVGKSLAAGLLGSVLALSALDRTLGGSARPAAPPPPSAASAATPSAHRPGLAVPSSTVRPTSALPAVIPPIPTAPPLSAEKAPETARAPLEAAAGAPTSVRHSDGLLALDALARVRRALSAHDSGRAMALLNDFEQRFPASQVAEEAAVLRIETLRALGKTSEAHALGVKFLQDRPFSVYGAKVRAMTEARDQVSNRGH
jgi:hypothetical protein